MKNSRKEAVEEKFAALQNAHRLGLHSWHDFDYPDKIPDVFKTDD